MNGGRKEGAKGGAACLVIALAFLGLGAARAVAAEGEDLFGLDLAELLDVKVKVASRTEDTVRDAPSSVTVFTKAEIQNMGVRSLEELLRFVPGFTVERTDFLGMEWALVSRGFWGVNDSAILLLVDGIRVNDHFSGSFGFMNRLVSIGMVERVEIVRGPGSALFGSNAYFGVINVVTTRADSGVTAEVGELSSWDAAVSAGRQVGSLEISGFLRAFGEKGESYPGIYDPFRLDDDTTDPISGEDGHLTLRIGRFTGSVRYQEREIENFYLQGNLADRVNRLETGGVSAHAAYAFDVREGWSGSVSAGFYQYRGRFLAKWVDQGFGPFQDADLLVGAEHVLRSAYAAADMVTRLGARSTLSWGVVYEVASSPGGHLIANYDILDEFRYLGGLRDLDDEAHRVVADEQRQIGGVYVEDRIELPASFRLVAGLRYDVVSEVGSATSPRLALMWSGERGTTLKLMGGLAFQAPPMEKLYMQNNPFELANPDLEPQRIETYELSWLQEAGSVQTTLTYFENREHDVFDLVATDPDPSNPDPPGFHTVNGPDRRSRGFEAEVAAELGSHVLLRASASHVLSGERAEAPATLASLIVNGAFGRVNANVSASWQGDREALSRQGAFALVNSCVRVDVGRGVDAYVAGTNLLDEEHLSFTRYGDYGLPNRGRQLRIGIHASF